jgi:hypothetical protein
VNIFFITSYVPRNAVMRRVDKGESIQMVQKYNPDRLDYYRVDLNNILQLTSTISPTETTHPHIETMYIDEILLQILTKRGKPFFDYR